WGEASYREIAEAMHGDGMMDEVMVSLLTPDAAAAPSPRWPHAPAQPELAEDFDWEGFAAELVMQREQEAAKAAAQSGRDETNAPPHTPAREAPPPPPPGPRVRVL